MVEGEKCNGLSYDPDPARRTLVMISDPEAFFSQGCGRCDRFATPDCSARLWTAGLSKLRGICLDMALAETVKWGHPCYTHADRNIALITAFRGDFRLSFMNVGLLEDNEGVLELQGPNSARPSMIRFIAVEQVDALRPVIRAYLRQLMDAAEAGVQPPARARREIAMPEELVEAMDADPELAEAFSALTPGRQNSYLFSLSQAKHSTTRTARIAKYREKIMAGKGALDR